MINVVDPRTGKEVAIRGGAAYGKELWESRHSCTHDVAILRVFTSSNGALAYCKQCQTCGKRVGNPVPKQPNIAPADPQIAARYDAEWKRIGDEITVKHIKLNEANDSLWWHEYNLYLKTPEWCRRAQLVRSRCGGICEGCGEAEVDEVHHLTYEHVRNEFLFELVGLCHACHDRIHPEPAA